MLLSNMQRTSAILHVVLNVCENDSCQPRLCPSTRDRNAVRKHQLRDAQYCPAANLEATPLRLSKRHTVVIIAVTVKLIQLSGCCRHTETLHDI